MKKTETGAAALTGAVSLGGIDPSIIRELSGVYKPFVKAFKELISNAFDADADAVGIEFADDFSSVTVFDDGSGMTPFEFRNDFTRIGGGSRRWVGDETRKGRWRIGNKGIGFLALARYCANLEVESAADRRFKCSADIPKTPSVVDLASLLGIPISPDLLTDRLTAKVYRKGAGRVELKPGRHFKLDLHRLTLSIKPSIGPVRIELRVACKGLFFHATLDFDRLLQLADKVDLEKLNQFAFIQVREEDENSRGNGTRITARGIKSFVQRELRSPRRKGFAEQE